MKLASKPKEIKQLISRRVKGESLQSIATDLGVDKSTVSRALNKPVVRQLLERAYADIASLAPDVSRAYQEEIKAIPKDLDERKLRIAVAKEIAGMIGLSPVRDSHNNVFFTSIVAPTQVHLSPIVARLLDKIADPTLDDEPIDVEYTT